ncbi:Signal recognition particle 9 kDa protein [Hondaea fermentalgiana]|uniref:Signal recognition particle 9 kDa protein n=1 Tax=Hondaea fermentalgiana TaxID=2315210 RepID=A0A2R5GLT6_9STRA|nr:Signal recognition particle 9 kDa protein [Hondaea fermentalgiana]|eukprot:GBG31595.1 Signal recognition particle 9 kDa protein [Hondaea fermentalgiana]
MQWQLQQQQQLLQLRWIVERRKAWKGSPLQLCEVFSYKTRCFGIIAAIAKAGSCAVKHIDNVEEFVFRAKELALKRGDAVRYNLKYVNKLGRLAAKVTDDQVCLTHETDVRAEIYVLNELTEWFFCSCTGVKRPRVDSGAELQLEGVDEKLAAAAGTPADAKSGTSAAATTAPASSSSSSEPAASTGSKNNSSKKKKNRKRR